MLSGSDERSLLEFACNEGFCASKEGDGRAPNLLRVGVDARHVVLDVYLCCVLIVCSTWMHSVCPVFRHNHAGVGSSPELRALFYRLATILAMSIHAFFVFDGRARPNLKRSTCVHRKSHWLVRPFQELLNAFGFSWCEVSAVAWYPIACPSSFSLEAPGEAEAELAALNQHGLVNMVLTTDSDAVVFSATCIARWYVFGVHVAW